MLPDGTLEPFDWQYIQPFKHWAIESSEEGLSFPGSPRQKRQNIIPVTIRTAMEFIDETLRSYQAYRLPHKDNPLKFTFPYAIYLNEGTKFLCRETQEIYKVDHTFKDENGRPTGDVTLNTESGRFLKAADRLITEHGEKNSIHFFHAWPKSMPEIYKWDLNGDLVENGAMWTDTITWSVVRSEPGSLSHSPFAGTRELKPRFREFMVEEQENCDYVRMIAGQLFDTVVQFDIWSQEPLRATILSEWFANFMDLHRWIFLYNGVQQTYFWKQQSDALATRWRNDIVNASVQWYFRTENLLNRRIRKIRDISLEVETLARGEQFISDDIVIDPAGCIDPTGIIVTSVLDNTGVIF